MNQTGFVSGTLKPIPESIRPHGLACPHWTEEELSELTGWTRLDRERDEARRERAKYRLEFLWKRIEETVELQENIGEEPTELEEFSFNDRFDPREEDETEHGRRDLS
ncbi:hypothetical protein NJB93_19365 [Brucella intermedia]|uniref:hypothetical protein n=1 Tax=Brucella intermedia TaxID=94625 RepID=UPI00209A7511|nr:hypothetical protein [Brucella intermedia]MCO7728742.1 hypothetical protein [Brucella intermedia]